MPTVVGEMMPLRSGYDRSRPWVSVNDFWSSSLPYAVVTSWMPLYWGFFSSVFISAIHAFWLVALGVADRIATLPEPPIACEISLTCTWAMPSAVAWLTNRARQDGVGSEAYVTALAPALRAWLGAPPM